MALLEITDLRVQLPRREGWQAVVDGVSVGVDAGEVLGIAGESGSGKTMTALALLGLLPHASQVSGSARFAGRELVGMSHEQLRGVRGREIAMVFQDPATALHPMLPVRTLLTEHMRHHLGLDKRAARGRALELLEQVRIPDPARTLHAYPHELSGGMRQRVAIAAALACGPKLLLADEPTTALDVTVQAGILRLLDRLRRETELAVVVITHDLGVISALADHVAVMRHGAMVEQGTTSAVLTAPAHEYTRALLDALPPAHRGAAS
jgi:oligopeptide transport system ATP-binding protein